MDYRKHDLKILLSHLKLKNSVELVGMKKVGINHFLKYFLNEFEQNPATHRLSNYIIIPVDLNELIETELLAFWRLTLKRILDKTTESKSISGSIKEEANHLFIQAIQSGDLFLTTDAVRRILLLISKQKLVVYIFFIRFDRLQAHLNGQLFNNLYGISDISNNNVNFLFTSFRRLEDLSPVKLRSLKYSPFIKTMYIKTASKKDSRSLVLDLASRYHTTLSFEEVTNIVRLSGGHLNYMHLLLLKQLELEPNKKLLLKNSEDERLYMQSEELFSRLNKIEKLVLGKVLRKQPIKSREKKLASYLWDVGFINKQKIFSPLLEEFLKSTASYTQHEGDQALTKKEYLLFELLKANQELIVDRETIARKVWPEYREFGVSDWTIDRLVFRLRRKLKANHPGYQLRTIKTRGFILQAE